MNKAVFFDRDGTIAEDSPYCSRPEDFHLFPATPQVFKTFNQRGVKVVIITNQSGIGRGYFDEPTLAGIHEKMKADLAREGAYVDAIYYCPHHPDDNCACRKPKPALILRAARELAIDLKKSFVVGDMSKDIEAGKAAGCYTILIGRPADAAQCSPDACISGISDVTPVVLAQTVNSKNTLPEKTKHTTGDFKKKKAGRILIDRPD
jgi:D-glycero-D-manno-heptose 1,7-bisphosphate phosphatase